MTKSLFLDRDGVINYDSGYVHNINEFRFIEGIFSLLKEAISKNYIIIIITKDWMQLTLEAKMYQHLIILKQIL